jgi:hypothetical protein
MEKGETERALFLDRLHRPLPTGFHRLYFGAEFCPWAFPSLTEFEQAIEFARELGCAFTLATPVLAESLLPRLRSVLQHIHGFLTTGDEILINDLGAIQLVREFVPDLPIILGRVLSGQKRGPQILDLHLGEEALAYFRQGSWYTTEAVSFLTELGISRVELDNLLQGIAPLPAGLKGSLHYPYAMVTSSRNCPFRPAGAECDAGCGEIFSLTTVTSQLPLIQGGNTQFIRHDRLPEDRPRLGIDRLVFHPRLPR